MYIFGKKPVLEVASRPQLAQVRVLRDPRSLFQDLRQSGIQRGTRATFRGRPWR